MVATIEYKGDRYLADSRTHLSVGLCYYIYVITAVWCYCFRLDFVRHFWGRPRPNRPSVAPEVLTVVLRYLLTILVLGT